MATIQDVLNDIATLTNDAQSVANGGGGGTTTGTVPQAQYDQLATLTQALLDAPLGNDSAEEQAVAAYLTANPPSTSTGFGTSGLPPSASASAARFR